MKNQYFLNNSNGINVQILEQSYLTSVMFIGNSPILSQSCANLKAESLSCSCLAWYCPASVSIIGRSCLLTPVKQNIKNEM